MAGASTAIALAGIRAAERTGAKRIKPDLGFVPIVVQDARGAGNIAAAERSMANLAFSGDAIMTDADALCAAIS